MLNLVISKWLIAFIFDLFLNYANCSIVLQLDILQKKSITPRRFSLISYLQYHEWKRVHVYQSASFINKICRSFWILLFSPFYFWILQHYYNSVA